MDRELSENMVSDGGQWKGVIAKLSVMLATEGCYSQTFSDDGHRVWGHSQTFNDVGHRVWGHSQTFNDVGHRVWGHSQTFSDVGHRGIGIIAKLSVMVAGEGCYSQTFSDGGQRGLGS
ncbi:hypothetical protein ElyMa_005946500 [Elysia marginata]|uniref:Uncharacterized protein n=1 Tax=Elysia marginata TaxID=1093978 RepID=A0AAV4G9Z0_9GAST|nr:hypothetical protein ElyMa_005946500 [Elysia marginata]